MSNFAVTPNNAPLGIAQQIAWEQQYQTLLKQFLKQFHTFDGSRVCEFMRLNGLHDPMHHNMWAAQINYYAGQGWMVPVGRSRFAAGEQSHGRDITVWQSSFCKAPKVKGKKVVI